MAASDAEEKSQRSSPPTNGERLIDAAGKMAPGTKTTEDDGL